jgi:sugar-specific transcriptional regulator TrmB
MDIEQVLHNFGFSEKETSVYLSLLELETATATQVADHSQINRSTVYVVIESLQKKGLISVHKEDGSATRYIASPIERLLESAKSSRNKYTNMIKEIEKILPEMQLSIESKKARPRVQFFEGKKGLIKAYEDTLTSSEEILAYASIENMHKSLPGYFPDYYKRRASNGIPIRSIHPNTEEARERIKHDKEESRNSALVPTHKYSFSPEINIYDNKVVFMSLVEKFSLIIESQELADAFKKVFELSWKEAKRLDKKSREVPA